MRSLPSVFACPHSALKMGQSFHLSFHMYCIISNRYIQDCELGEEEVNAQRERESSSSSRVIVRE